MAKPYWKTKLNKATDLEHILGTPSLPKAHPPFSPEAEGSSMSPEFPRGNPTQPHTLPRPSRCPACGYWWTQRVLHPCTWRSTLVSLPFSSTKPSRGTWLKKWLCKKHQDFPRFGGQLGERGRGDLKIMKKIKSNMKVSKVFIWTRPWMGYENCVIRKCSGVKKHLSSRL